MFDISQGLRLTVVMTGPLPPAVGGMASVIGALGASSLSDKVRLKLFETGKTTPEGRSLWLGFITRLRLLIDWWKILGNHGQPTIAHIHTCSGFTFFLDGVLLLIAKLRGVPVVLHVHGAMFDFFLDGLKPPLNWLARWLARKAEVVVVLSEEWRNKLNSRLPGVNFAVLANGVPSFSKNTQISLENKTPSFLFLGNLGVRKGVPVLFKALTQSKTNWKLVMAGGEEDSGYLKFARDEILRLGLAERVSILGPVVGNAKSALLQEADAFVLPSLAEGLPMALLEAMAAHLPVVVTAVGAMPGVVRDGVEGYLVTPGDAEALSLAMDRLSLSASDRNRMGEAAAATCEKAYGIERMVDTLMQIYQRELFKGT